MRFSALRWLVLTVAVAVAGGATSPPPLLSRFRAVLVAGDFSAAAFDHATEAMRDRLLASGIASEDIQRLTASRAVAAQEGLRFSGLHQVVGAIEHLRPAVGQGCFVFATSHGAYQDGLVLVPSQNFLTPFVLDRALARGCGEAPTVVIVSGCYSGEFTRPPMARANRIVLTAAREDRPSFGCGAGFQYTVYDRCLLQAIDRSGTWRAAFEMVRGCVANRERALRARASEPQAWFGEMVAGLGVLGRGG